MSQGSFPKMVQSTARGSVVLMIGQMISGVISTVAVIWMARALGPISYGEYTLALLPVSIAMLFQDLGMNQSLIRFSAMYRYEKRIELRMVVWTGLLFSLGIAVIISSLLYFLAGPIASFYLHRPELKPLVEVAAFAVLGNGGIQMTVGAIFVGYEMMSLRSLVQILFSVSRLAIGVALIMIGLGSYGAVFSYSAAMIFSGLIGFGLFLKFIKFEPGQKGGFDFDTLKTLLRYGFPLSVGHILGGIAQQLYNSLLAFYVATELIGNYGATLNFGIVIQFITIPISSALLPFFSKFKRDDPRVKTIFNLSVKYTALVTLPVVLLVIAVSTPLSQIIFGSSYPFVPLYLSLYLLVYAFEGLGGLTVANLISGIGETGQSMRASFINLLVGGTLAFILIPRYQVVGLLVTMIIAPRFGWILNTFWIKKNLGFSVDWVGTARIYFSGLIAFIPTYLVVHYANLGNWLTLLLGGVVYMTVYFVCIPLNGVLKKADLEQLSATAATFGPLSKILETFIRILSRFVKK